MSWELLDDVPVTFEGRQLDGALIGDVLIKVEHDFNGAIFPGKGFAWISDLYYQGEELEFIKSYPFKETSRIYALEIPPVMREAGWLLRFLFVRRSRYARVDADANWRIRVYEWVGSTPPESTVNVGGVSDGGDQEILDGNP